MKRNITNLFIVFLLLTLANVLKAQCAKENIKVPSNLVFHSEEGGPQTLVLETKGIKRLKLSLYTGRGTKVFESSSSILGASAEVVKMLDTGWDGTNLGEKLKAGFYVYTIEADCIDQNSVYKTGQIVLSLKSKE